MAEKTNIAWTDSTWNPWIGCKKVGLGCDHCYAEALNNRHGWVVTGDGKDDPDAEPFWGGSKRKRTSAANWRQPLRWNRKAEIAHNAWEKFKTSYIGLTDADLEEKGFVKTRRPRVFCGSLCDVFDNAVPEQWRADLFELIRQCQHLDFLLLTKRIGNAREMILRAKAAGSGIPWPPEPNPNVWLGITVCNQEEADRDIPKLLAVPAAKRFLSIEPMLGPIKLRDEWLYGDEEHGVARRSDGSLSVGGTVAYTPPLNWIICGGEAGPHARPMHPDWVRSLRDQCQAAGTAFFFKQWGAWHPNCLCDTKRPHTETPRSLPGIQGVMFRCGKKGKRLLDWREWSEVPA